MKIVGISTSQGNVVYVSEGGQVNVDQSDLRGQEEAIVPDSRIAPGIFLFGVEPNGRTFGNNHIYVEGDEIKVGVIPLKGRLESDGIVIEDLSPQRKR